MTNPLAGKVGLGLRRDLVRYLSREHADHAPDFIELAPENWMEIGGHWRRTLLEMAERYPIICHGLSLSIGSPGDLDRDHLRKVKRFLDEVGAVTFSEHLSFTRTGNAHLYELLPLPFRRDAASFVAGRIREAQEILERKIAIENVSYYLAPAAELAEFEFLAEILELADCDLLLDVNNLYVNSKNHGYDPLEFLDRMPLERVALIHAAGHEQRYPELIIDTHGAPIADPVYKLLAETLTRIAPPPVLLERDFEFPSDEELDGELAALRSVVAAHGVREAA